MATVSITLKISLDEANLLMKLLDEGEEQRQNLGRMLKEAGRDLEPNTKNTLSKEYQLTGQEALAIQALRRGIQGANR